MTIIEALEDDKLFKPLFKDLSTWATWRVWLKVVFALKLTREELHVYRTLSGRRKVPSHPREIYTICGRRSGKSFMASLAAVYLGTFVDYRPYLAKGERATIMLIAKDRVQAGVIFRYVKGILDSGDLLRRMIIKESGESIDLKNDATISVFTRDYGSIRGQTLAAAICDELAFWNTEGGNPDREVLAALRPGLATIPGSKLFALSTPYSKAGVLYDIYREHYGKQGRPDLLVWRAPTKAMNPTIGDELIAHDFARDPQSAKSEWQAEFRDDISSAFPMDLLDACTIRERRTLPPAAGVRYHAFVDPSGGSRDAFTVAVGHRTPDTRVVIDALQGWRPPFSPEKVVHDIAMLVRPYRLMGVTGDRYAGEWPRERFRTEGLTYTEAPAAKSELYLALLPLLTSASIELPDVQELRYELSRLERRTTTIGRDVVDHPQNGHDDLANSVAGVAYLLSVVHRSRWTFGFSPDSREPAAYAF
jgi:hypothetical protein